MCFIGYCNLLNIISQSYLSRFDPINTFTQRPTVSHYSTTSNKPLSLSLSLPDLTTFHTQSQRAELNQLNERAQAILRQADPPNRERIDAQNAGINGDWSAQVGRFEQRREQLTTLQQQWEQYENRVHAFENQVIRLEERAAHVDPVVRSRRQLEDTKHVIQVSGAVDGMVRSGDRVQFAPQAITHQPFAVPALGHRRNY